MIEDRCGKMEVLDVRVCVLNLNEKSAGPSAGPWPGGSPVGVEGRSTVRCGGLWVG